MKSGTHLGHAGFLCSTDPYEKSYEYKEEVGEEPNESEDQGTTE
jgi:hypothetical protein